VKQLEGGAATRAFIVLERGYGLDRRFALDAFANQLSDEPFVAERLALALDIQARVEPIVEEAFALAAFDCGARVVIVEAFALEVLPQPGLGAPLPRQKRESGRVSCYGATVGAGALPLVEALFSS
jgi:hypothetical protein